MTSIVPIKKGLNNLYDLEIEQSVLGSILLNNKLYESVSEFLRADHFYAPIHSKIYSLIEKLIESGEVADSLTLRSNPDGSRFFQSLEDKDYLFTIMTNVLLIESIEHYGRIIHEFYLKRMLVEIGSKIISNAYNTSSSGNALNQIELAEKDLYELASQGSANKDFISLSEVIKKISKDIESDKRTFGIPLLKFQGLEDLLGGLHRSDLIILAGRPSMGKTAFAINIAYDVASNKKEINTVAFFSLEMSAEQLTSRILSSMINEKIPRECDKISSDSFRRRDFKSKHIGKLFETVTSASIDPIPLYIDDTPLLSVSQIISKSRRLKRQKGLGMIVIDYLQLLEPSKYDQIKRVDNRVQEISKITRSLKALAKELDVPVLVLSQLSRAVEQREDKRPQLSDLRESGSIEQDADVVMFIFREEYYVQRRTQPKENSEAWHRYKNHLERIKNSAEIIIAKQRNGPIGNVNLYFDSKTTMFRGEKEWIDR